MRLLRSAAALLTALMVAACSSATSGQPSSAPSPSTSQPTSTPPTSAAPTSAPPSALSVVLLAPAEVGAGFRASPPNSAQTALPCTPNDPPLTRQVPVSDKAVGLYVNSVGTLALEETVYAYGNAATSQKALAAVEKGLGCRSGRSNGAAMRILGPTDLRSKITARVNRAEAWAVGTSKMQGTIVAVVVGEKLIGLQFAAQPGTDTSKVDARQIIETAIAKVLNGR